MSGADWTGRKLHFVGIGGSGMSGLALSARALGASVSGSDRSESRYMPQLRAAGIEPLIGHRAGNVPAGAEVVYSTAVPADNPERLRARGPEGAGELHRSQLLAQIAACKRCLAVAGTHGKTTTTGMLVSILRGCGLDPAYVVGAELVQTGRSAEWGDGEWIVVEADESDRSLLQLSPEIVVLTNAELDHHSTYGSLAEVEAVFRRFITGARAAVVWDRPQLTALAAGADAVFAYDAVDPQPAPDGVSFRWRVPEAAAAAAGGEAGADAQDRAVRELPVTLGVNGVHNAINAAGALTAAALAGAEPERAATALRSFAGARGRLEHLGETPGGARVYYDYAHHPTEVAATLAAARTLGASRLVVVFQPHLFSRTRALASDIGKALAAADLCGVLDIYPARERAADFPGVTGRLVVSAAAAAGAGEAAWVPTLVDAQRWLGTVLAPDDVCVVMGAGNIDTLGRALIDGVTLS
jgi:UDP-N-acetylmuramate--alanine ligase